MSILGVVCRDIRMNAYQIALLRKRDAAGAHLERLRARGDSRKRCRIGAGHPDLRIECGERIVERGAAAGVEMRDDLVQQQQRRVLRHLGDQPRMREHQPDQQRLLLAG